MRKPPYRRFWFTAFVVAGIALAGVLLGQTLWTYVFVSRDLVRREARRQAARDVTALERAIFTGGVRDPEPLGEVVRGLQRDASTRIAWITVVTINGQTLAGSVADQQTLFTAADMKGTVFAREEPSRRVWKDGRDIRVYLFPLRLPPQRAQTRSDVPPADSGVRPSPPRGTGPVLAEIGINLDAVSAQFGGLRRASLVNILAAAALIAAVIAIALRFPAYVRGRQTEAQLLLARRVQQNLLPSAMPVLRHAQVGAICVPASDVGGDLFDLVSLDDDRFVFLLGDVSGKGVSAALLMAVVEGAFHGGKLGAAAGEIRGWMRRLNRLLIERSAENRFVTLFCGAFDARKATLTYVNAGHLPPLVYRADQPSREPERLTTGGPVVGLLPDAAYEEGQTVIRQGDIVVMYSDGVTEATNQSGDEFGVERLSAMIDGDGDEFERGCGRVLAAVETFTSRIEPEDDQTVMMVRFSSVGSSVHVLQPRAIIGELAARGRHTRSEREHGKPAITTP